MLPGILLCREYMFEGKKINQLKQNYFKYLHTHTHTKATSTN